MKCPACQHENPDEFNFCMNCGSALRYSCPNCGVPIRAGARFCDSCGASLMAATKAESADDTPTSRVLWKAFIRFVAAFAIVYGLISGVDWILTTPMGNSMPFLGIQSARAGSVAQTYVDRYFTEFSQAERSVFPAYVDEQPVYVVDFVRSDQAQGLRVLVSRDLSAVWAFQLVEGK